MKTIFTFMLTSFLAVAAFAADVAGKVTVTFSGNKDYTVLIDGKTYQSGNRNRISLDDLRPGRHTIQVYTAKKLNRRNSKPVHATHFIVKPQFNTHISIDRNGKVDIDERRAFNNRRDDDRRNDRDREDRYDRKDERYSRNDDRYGRNNEDRYERDEDYRGGNNYNRAMSENDFSDFLQKVRNQWIGKLGTAKDGISKNYFTTSQVKQILQVFSSESDRLELAKLSYSKVIDVRFFKQQLYELFSYNAQVELDKYINDRRY